MSKSEKFYRLVDTMIIKRKAHYTASGFTSVTNSNHMCAILKNSEPISYGTNIYTVNDISTEHAEAQALRRLYEKINKSLNAKKITLDIMIVRTGSAISKPCTRCINTMKYYSKFFYIRNVYYTDPNELGGIRCIKFSKLVNEKHHTCSFDRNCKN